MKKIIGILVMTLLITTTMLSALGSMNDKMCSNSTMNNLNENVVWDNGMNYDGLGVSQVSEVAAFDWIGADDFLFEEDTKVIGYKSIPGFKGPDYEQASFNWTVQFHLDRGDGNAPGEVFAGPISFTFESTNPVLIEDTGSEIFYDAFVEFPEAIEFQGGEKYWLSAWCIGEAPTMGGAGYHFDPIKLHQCVGKSEYSGHPDWQNAENISTDIDDPIDACFQLITSIPPTVPDIDGPSTGKAGVPKEYTFSSMDLDGHEISYIIDWGDDSVEITLGPFPSEQEVKESHTWSEDGKYTIQIKARDSYGFESEVATLEVSMPKAKGFNNPLLRFLENYPNLFPLLRQILGI